MDKKYKQSQNDSLIQEIRKLLGYVGRRRQRQLGMLLLLMLASSLSEMVSLGAIYPFLEALINPQDALTNFQWKPLIQVFKVSSPVELVLFLAVIFIVTIVVANGLRLLTLNAQFKLSAGINSDLSSQIYQKILYQPYSFHLQHNSSDLLQTLIDDTTRLSTNVLMPFLAFLTNSFLVIGLMGTLIAINGRISILISVILGLIYIGIYQFRKHLLKRNSKIIAKSGQRKVKAVQEGLGAIRDILTTNTQNYFQQSYYDSEYLLRKTIATNNLVAQVPRYLVEAVAMTVIVLLALSLGKDGDFSEAIPVLGSLTLGAKRLLPSLQAIFASLATIQGAREAIARLLAGLERKINPEALPPVYSEPLLLEKELILDKIWFQYSNEANWILKDLNLKIQAKTIVGFVGSTGSGKSTTADLILGLLYPQKGSIWIDGQPLTRLRLKQWRQGIAHVPQSIFLTDATIAENIAFAIPKGQIQFEQVQKAARLAQLDSFIQALPAGYDTYVGERGVRLSGGQRQRIGIARALYHQASVIIFDEATSALDNETEKEVMKAIQNLSHRFTIILIAHRLSTVEKCDKIFELHMGQVIAEGTYEELKRHSASFQRMASVGSSLQ